MSFDGADRQWKCGKGGAVNLQKVSSIVVKEAGGSFCVAETNDAVTVAGMIRPKQLPNEHLSDLVVSMATKLQCFRHLGKYLKQSAKALEQQVAREARFYGALIRLQQNWKVKWHRMVAAASGNEGFYIDLFDNSLYDPAVAFRPSSASVVRVEHDPAGMLAVNLPPNSCRTLQFEFLGASAPGRVDTMQTLYNLDENELTGFEEAWKSKTKNQLPGAVGVGFGFTPHLITVNVGEMIYCGVSLSFVIGTMLTCRTLALAGLIPCTILLFSLFFGLFIIPESPSG